MQIYKTDTKSSKTQKMKNTHKGALSMRGRHLLILAAIPILYIIIFFYLPMVGIVIAFKDFRVDLGIFKSEWIGFKNFEYFFTSPDFARVAWNTIYLNARFIVTGMIAAVTLAIILYELKSRMATKIYQTVLITPHFISWVIVGYMVYGFLNPEHGIINNILANMGIDKVNWYGEPKLWPGILNIASIWKSIGMDAVLYYAALMGIDESLFEAAAVDGANRLQKIRYVTLPCLKTIIIIQLILKIGGIFRADFGLFYQVTQDIGTLYPTTDVMDTYIFRTMRTVRDYGMSSAAGLLQSVVGLVLVVITNKIVNKVDEESALF